MNKVRLISATTLYSRDGESKHMIYEVGLADGARLHRFRNAHGEPLSAVYNRYYEEVMRCPRENEDKMVESWNAAWRASRAMEIRGD